MTKAAPFDVALSEGPADVDAFWASTSDGKRLRLGHWPAQGTARGTILLFTGRSEYLEKYGRVATEFTAAGFDLFSTDWRGQGYSDRLTDDVRLGHIRRFSDYQLDVAAMIDAAKARGLPEPFILIGHSMGGCIGLRALVEGLNVSCAIFSAPMWGIFVDRGLGPVAKFLPTIAKSTGQGMRTLPGTRPTNYATDTSFVLNLLTGDRDHYEYMIRHAEAHPELALGGPTFYWFAAARREMAALLKAKRPILPVETYLGTREAIVDPKAIRLMHESWPSATLNVVDGARHEIMMEVPELRSRFMDGAIRFISLHL